MPTYRIVWTQGIQIKVMSFQPRSGLRRNDRDEDTKAEVPIAPHQVQETYISIASSSQPTNTTVKMQKFAYLVKNIGGTTLPSAR